MMDPLRQQAAENTLGATALAARFTRFAERECRGVSPLYRALARAVAKDAELLALAAGVGSGQPAPNMLFAAVRLLLLGAAADDPLAGFYADLAAAPRPARRAFPVFRDFCLRHQHAVAEILRTRVVSTNEAARSACLLPAFVLAARHGSPGPLHLVDIGASAGFNLLWDRYAYDYCADGRIGAPTATVQLVCRTRGRRAPPLPEAMPAVGARIGIDRHPIDAANEADARWLRALIWPEQPARLARLASALAAVRAEPPRLVAGDVLACLPAVLRAMPAQGTLCLYHSFTLNQFPASAQVAFAALLQDVARDRPFVRIGLEWGDGPAPELRFYLYDGGAVETHLLAHCDPHGAWIEWLAAQAGALKRRQRRPRPARGGPEN